MIWFLQGWWWEGEAGLLAPQEEEEWRFSHACCACNVLRNIAMEPRNHALLTGDTLRNAFCTKSLHAVHFMLVPLPAGSCAKSCPLSLMTWSCGLVPYE